MLHRFFQSIRRLTFLSLAFALLFSTPLAAQQPSKQKSRERGIGVSASAVKELPAAPKRFALVIGVDAYDDTQITTLGGASNDARTLRDALVQYAGFPADQVTLLASDQPAERQPTRGNILRRLSNLAGTMPKDGLLLVSFAGHGMERGGQAFLLPKDAQASDDVYLLEQTAINVQQMHELIRRIGVKQVLLILDACRNDPVGRSDTDNPLTSAYTRGFNFDILNKEVTAFATLYATEVGKRAYEYKERQQGYFTWALVEALKGAAANERGEVTLAGLVAYLQDRVPKLVQLDLGAGKVQKPFAEIGGYRADELVLAVVPNARTSVAKTVAKGTQTANAQSMMTPQMMNAATELSFWETIKNSADVEDFREYLKKYPKGQFAGLARRRIQIAEAAEARGRAKSDAVNANAAASNAKAASARRSIVMSPTMTNRFNMDFILIQPGNFLMGSTKFDRESPAHRVALKQSFYMSKYLVTQAQWVAIMGSNPSYFWGSDHPVENVSWNDVQDFLRRLNAIEEESGFLYRLPTEAEWEYATRAGTDGDYAGNIETMGWYEANAGERTHPVGQKEPNAFGLYDVHGNVWQMVQDYYHESYAGAPTDGSAWLTGGDQQYRVIRGGSWCDGAEFARSANRGRIGTSSRYSNVGFRLVAVPRN
jgi:formylglycine-generating enzyme required for sulfatase activity